jgi:hypothetical protein
MDAIFSGFERGLGIYIVAVGTHHRHAVLMRELGDQLQVGIDIAFASDQYGGPLRGCFPQHRHAPRGGAEPAPL